MHIYKLVHLCYHVQVRVCSFFHGCTKEKSHVRLDTIKLSTINVFYKLSDRFDLHIAIKYVTSQNRVGQSFFFFKLTVQVALYMHAIKKCT